MQLQVNQGYQYLLQGKYTQAISFYEEAISAHPTQITNYWYLGLTQLLQGNEEEAQTTWLLAMLGAGEERAIQCSGELFQVLQAEAQRQEELENYQIAWIIRQHARQFFPEYLDNLLKIIWLSLNKLNIFTPEDLTDLSIIEIIESEKSLIIDKIFLLMVIEKILEHLAFEPTIFKFVKACSRHFPHSQAYIDVLMSAALNFSMTKGQPKLAIQLVEVCLEIDPDNKLLLLHLAHLYQNAGNYIKGVEVTKYYQNLCRNLLEHAYACHLLLRSFLTAGGYWKEAYETFNNYLALLLKLAESQPTEFKGLLYEMNLRIFNTAFFLPYFQDNPKLNRLIQNQLSYRAYNNLQIEAQKSKEKFQINSFNRSYETLKIGFVSHCFRQHSVGWLSRWFFKYYDREKFRIHLYFNAFEPENVFSEEWFIQNVWQAHSSISSVKLAEQVYEDKINILVDLDSITLDTTCELFAYKPAPIQVTWLGWDASGIPAIDYFIADPYVLPENAQDYYQEKIWRLPQTYVAVDGFEVGVPTLRRAQLEIPSDAVVYLSAQRGYKRHPDTARLQMKILKEVPNSCFLIKGLGDEVAIQQFFTQIAEEEGVDPGRLRFPPLDCNEFVHRANLGIADVVLDTYPYNGATTTLETLWMGIPLVTRVGEQFAARNSYAFLKNVGVTEGIAWTDEEYIEWGVRLGKDEALRQQVAWKLKASRQTSPLWNAKQFTREMETAFKQMWARYVAASR